MVFVISFLFFVTLAAFLYQLNENKKFTLIFHDLKKAEADLFESREKYRKIFNNIQDIYFEISVDGLILEISPSIGKVSEYKREDVIGKYIHEFFFEENVDDFFYKKLLFSKQNILSNYELIIVDKNQKKRYTLINCFLEKDIIGRPYKICGSATEITKLKKTEEDLIESKKKYIGIFYNIQDAYFELNIDGKILEISPAIEKSTNFLRSELIGRYIDDFVVEENLLNNLLKVLEKDVVINDFEIFLKDKYANFGEVSIKCELLKDKDNHPLKIIGSIRDIRDRKKAENILKESNERLEKRVEERTRDLIVANEQLNNEIQLNKDIAQKLEINEKGFRTLTENSPDIIIRHNKEFKILFVNKNITKLTDKTCDLLMDVNIDDAGFNEDFCLKLKELVKEILEDNRPKDLEYIKDSKNGKKYYNFKIIPETGDNKNIESILCTGRDVTRLVKAEKQIHSLTKELIRASDSERKKIAGDLHDHVAQELATIKILASRLDLEINSKNHKLDDLVNRIGNCIEAIRGLAYELRPPAIEEFSLPQSIYMFIKDFSGTSGINIDFSSAGLEEKFIDFETKINLYRIVQEALNNIRKHTNADSAIVKLVHSHPKIILRIEDNGEGFDIKERSENIGYEKVMGIKSMEQRAAILDGSFSIFSKKGEGTGIKVEIPVKN